ncbi:MAG: hypothetical protein PHY34_01970 [Patescibacteria group bacterium]|nr:hypothetical protein [Patescibacteria group bacterium]MDD5715298.1 hypothetical protein [Patescibacteria group bacterium]
MTLRVKRTDTTFDPRALVAGQRAFAVMQSGDEYAVRIFEGPVNEHGYIRMHESSASKVSPRLFREFLHALAGTSFQPEDAKRVRVVRDPAAQLPGLISPNKRLCIAIASESDGAAEKIEEFPVVVSAIYRA